MKVVSWFQTISLITISLLQVFNVDFDVPQFRRLIFLWKCAAALPEDYKFISLSLKRKRKRWYIEVKGARDAVWNLQPSEISLREATY